MTILNETYPLNNDVQIPKLGFGTWQQTNTEVKTTVAFALNNGYRHIDTAFQYDNEEGVGSAINSSSIPRSEIFVTTKIPSHIKTYAETKDYIAKSLANLDQPYIDLLLIHSPKPWAELFTGSAKTYFAENLEVWRAMVEAYQAGQLKAIGVSNFSVADVQNILDHADVQPMVNQIQYHIGKTRSELVEFCQANNILVEAFSPIATGKLIDIPQLEGIAAHYGKSVPQLSIRYVVQKGLVPLPKSVHEKYIIQNAEVDFEITQADMALLDQLSID